MYTRETTAQGVSDPSALVEFISSTVMPGISQTSGFQDLSVSGDPSSGRVWVIANWATVDDLIESRSVGEQLRQQATQALGGTILGVREWVTPVVHVSGNPPAAGQPVNVNRHLYEPTLIQEVVSFFSWVAEPAYRSSPGFRSVQMLVDRNTGEVQVESTWDDVASLEEGFTKTTAIRDRAVEKGMRFVDRTRREVLFVAVPQFAA